MEMEIENLLSSMSTAFNSSPTPGADLNMNDDKTLKWRRHFKNQYAKKNQRKSAEDPSTGDENAAGAGDEGSHVEEENQKNHRKSTTPTLLLSAAAEPQITAAADKSPPADNNNKEVERSEAAAKQKKVKKSPNASPSRRSKRTKVEMYIQPVPQQKRRGRSKKAIEPAVGEKIKEQIQLESAGGSSPVKIEDLKKVNPEVVVAKKKRILPRNITSDLAIRKNMNDDEKQPRETNGNTTASNADDPIESPVIKKKKKRRSVRLGTKDDGPEALSAPTPRHDDNQNTEKAATTPEIISIKTEELDENESKIAIDKPPRKRGRRPKAEVASIELNNSNDRVQNKKSQRLSKDAVTESSNSSSSPPNPIVSKEKSNELPALSSQRPLRRIKPTVKILENEELRYEFETKNIARIVATSDKIGETDSTRSTPHRKESKETSTVPTTTTTTDTTTTISVKTKLFISPNQNLGSSIYPLKNSKPCREPQDFIKEIKAAGINLNRSPEDKKLNRKQHRKLLKQKEKLFERLGLRPNLKDDVTDSAADSSSDNDEFIPAKKISLDKSNDYALRMRHIRGNKESMKNHMLLPGHQSKRVETTTTVGASRQSNPSQNQPALISNPQNSSPTLNMICSCESICQFYASRTSKGVYCSAIDHIEDLRIGCCNLVTAGEVIPLFRPSQRVPYLVLCEDHLKRLKTHNSCAGCGFFCTQGKFILCKHKHFFHPGCAQKLILNTPYDPTNQSNHPSPTLVLKCPHCGSDTPEKESLITMRCNTTPIYSPSQTTVPVIKPARMAISTTRFRRTIPTFHTRLQQDLELVKLIPESVMNVVSREIGTSTNDFTTKDMFYAINNDDLERVAEIIASGYNITSEMMEFLNGTCLHLVAHFGTLQMAYLLLCRSSSAEFLNLPDRELRTAAMCAIMGEKCDILKLLIQAGADIAKKGPRGMHCLHYAAKCGSLPATQLLVESYSTSTSLKKFYDFINCRDEMGWTPLVWATEIGRTDIVSFLVNYGADITICDKENLTALHWAVLSNCDDVIKVLLQANADCNVQGYNGDTPLHIACRRLNTSACLILIASGADLMIKNRNGQVPYDCFVDEEDPCARAVGFNMQMRSFGPSGLQSKIVCSDISNGREIYPIQVVRREKLSKFETDDDIIIPDFKYITKTILLQNSVHIDCRVSQMRICSCDDGCTSDQCQCTNISLQNWYNSQGVLIEEFNFEDPPMIFECNDVCGCHILTCKNRVVQRGITLPLQVFECVDRTKGFGVRSNVEIACGQFVAEYTGEILTDMEADRRTDDSYFFELGSSDHCIDANFYGNVSRFLNHACEPNIVPVRVYFDHQDYRFPKIAFFACKNIEAGEEITFDYGDKFWAVKQAKFSCKCGATECRYSEQNK